MQTFSGFGCKPLTVVALSLSLVAGAASAAPGKVKFASGRVALDQGIAAYQSRNFAIAIPALEFAVEENSFAARYYLARIYADNNGPYTDHGEAYRLFREFAHRYANTDPADYRRAPVVARALTRIAKYLLNGLPEIGLRSDSLRAVEYFRHSATFFNEEDAQFELAKLQLTGEGMHRSVPRALNWFANLSRKGHPGAQAFLADLYWRGKYTRREPEKALALINVAIENATAEDRVWIEDIHQNIFCGSSIGTRRAVSGMVATWRNKFGRTRPTTEAGGLPNLFAGPVRTCANGEQVQRLEATPTVVAGPSSSKPASSETVPIQHGTMGGLGSGGERGLGRRN
ncbi:MAG: tetratricopeptide repeat protein [Hyphomicrobiaceae bacterium]